MKMFYWDAKYVTICEACIEKYHEVYSELN